MLADGSFLTYLTNELHPSLASEIPFIIVSSNDDMDALRICFKEGANDYLTKPFRKNELIVKIEQILKQRKLITKNLKPKIALDGIEVENLTSKQVKLMNLFLANKTRVVERKQILEKIWGDTTVHPKTIDVHLYNLRRKLSAYGYLIRSEGGGKWSLLQDKFKND